MKAEDAVLVNTALIHIIVLHSSVWHHQPYCIGAGCASPRKERLCDEDAPNLKQPLSSRPQSVNSTCYLCLCDPGISSQML